MSLATGGREVGAISTRSRSDSWARRSASWIETIPTCWPSGPTRRTSGTRIRSLMRGSALMGPPRLMPAWTASRLPPDRVAVRFGSPHRRDRFEGARITRPVPANKRAPHVFHAELHLPGRPVLTGHRTTESRVAVHHAGTVTRRPLGRSGGRWALHLRTAHVLTRADGWSLPINV